MTEKEHDTSKEPDKKNNQGSGQQNPGSGHSGDGQNDNKRQDDRGSSR